jgi:HEAT repeat protein
VDECYTETTYSEGTMTSHNLDAIAIQLDSVNARDRLQALTLLQSVPAVDAVPLIKKVLYDDHLPVRSLALYILARNPTDECFELLVELLGSDEDYAARAEAAAALGELGDGRAVEPLTQAFFEDPSWLVQFSVAVALGNLRDLRAKTVLRDALNRPEAVLKMAAISALGEIQDIESVDRLLQFVESEDWLIRQRLAEALGNLIVPKTEAALRYLQRDEHPQVAQAASFALQRSRPQT